MYEDKLLDPAIMGTLYYLERKSYHFLIAWRVFGGQGACAGGVVHVATAVSCTKSGLRQSGQYGIKLRDLFTRATRRQRVQYRIFTSTLIGFDFTCALPLKIARLLVPALYGSWAQK